MKFQSPGSSIVDIDLTKEQSILVKAQNSSKIHDVVDLIAILSQNYIPNNEGLEQTKINSVKPTSISYTRRSNKTSTVPSVNKALLSQPNKYDNFAFLTMNTTTTESVPIETSQALYSEKRVKAFKTFQIPIRKTGPFMLLNELFRARLLNLKKSTSHIDDAEATVKKWARK